MLPTALSLAAGFLLSWLGGRLANRKAVILLLYALVLAAVFYLAMNVNISMASLAAGTMGEEVEGAFTGWGVPSCCSSGAYAGTGRRWSCSAC